MLQVQFHAIKADSNMSIHVHHNITSGAIEWISGGGGNAGGGSSNRC